MKIENKNFDQVVFDSSRVVVPLNGPALDDRINRAAQPSFLERVRGHSQSPQSTNSITLKKLVILLVKSTGDELDKLCELFKTIATKINHPLNSKQLTAPSFDELITTINDNLIKATPDTAKTIRENLVFLNATRPYSVNFTSESPPFPPTSSNRNSLNDNDQEPLLSREDQSKTRISSPSKLAILRSNIAILESKGFAVIAKGADKLVLVREENVVRDPNTKKITKIKGDEVYYVPLRKWCFSKEKSVLKEMKRMKEIETHLKPELKKYLALEHEKKIVPELSGFHVFKVGRAAGDLESFIMRAPPANEQSKPMENTKQTLEINQRTKLVKDYLNGLKALHSVGYAYGDIKPENSLVYQDSEGNLSLKIADFGKSRKVDDKNGAYRGNLRFAPPEVALSKKGDVYSSAIVMIRALEEGLQDRDKPLFNLAESRKEASALTKRRGIEKLMVEHPAFVGLDETSLQSKLLKRLPRQLYLKLRGVPERVKQEQQKVLHVYIDNLCERLEGDKTITKNQKKQLGELLKSMVETNPKERPDMGKVVDDFTKLFPDKV